MANPGRRQPRVSSDQRNLAADVLEISNRVATVDRHLSELRDLQARAVALAASRRVPQRVLAEIVDVGAMPSARCCLQRWAPADPAAICRSFWMRRFRLIATGS